MHPSCKRCQNRGQKCPGYRDEFVIRVDGVSSYANKVSKIGRRTRARQVDLSTLDKSRQSQIVTKPSRVEGRSFESIVSAELCSNPLPAETMSHATMPATGISPNASLTLPCTELLNGSDENFLESELLCSPTLSLSESWNNHLICFIMNKFSFPVGDGQVESFFSIFSRLLSKMEEDSILYLAWNAVGWAYLANKSWRLSAISNRVQAYSRVLGAINQVLRDPEQYKSDRTLLTVWLLTLYEVR